MTVVDVPRENAVLDDLNKHCGCGHAGYAEIKKRHHGRIVGALLTPTGRRRRVHNIVGTEAELAEQEFEPACQICLYGHSLITPAPVLTGGMSAVLIGGTILAETNELSIETCYAQPPPLLAHRPRYGR